MTMASDHSVRSAWYQSHRRHRLSSKRRDATAMLVVLAACLAFWAATAYGLSLVV